MTTQNKKMIAYLRVSTKEQGNSGLGLEAQKANIEAYASLYNIDIVETVSESATGKNLNRDGLRTALAKIEAGDADGLIIAKLDRLTRSVKDMGTLLEKHFNHASLVCVADQIDTTTPAGRMILNILTSISQWEREAIVERTKDALQAKKARGEKTGGHCPYGYTADANGKLTPEPAEQKIIKSMIRLKKKGYTYQSIADKLAKDGVLTRTGSSKWTPATIRKIYKREAKA